MRVLFSLSKRKRHFLHLLFSDSHLESSYSCYFYEISFLHFTIVLLLLSAEVS